MDRQKIRIFAALISSNLMLMQLGCKPRINKSELLDDATTLPSFPSPEAFFEINRQVGHGDFFEVPVDATRKITQVTVRYHGAYSVYEKDSNGQVLKNDEGAPRYKDGMYAHGYLVDQNGTKREISSKKFVDAYETDNWHDLYDVRGKTLRVEFRHSPHHAEDPEVKAVVRTVAMQSVLVRYDDHPDEVYKEIRYSNDDNYGLSPDAKLVAAGKSHKISIPKSMKAYRVDVRWGDEKPRSSDGFYVAGTAKGRLIINGQPQGSQRNVAAIETQVWAPVRYTAANDRDTEIELAFDYDDARIHWVRVYYH